MKDLPPQPRWGDILHMSEVGGEILHMSKVGGYSSYDPRDYLSDHAMTLCGWVRLG